MPPFRDRLPHLVIKDSAVAEDYTSPNQAPRPRFPERNRGEHAGHLLNQVRAANQQAQQRRAALPIGAPAPDGLYLEFESQIGHDIKLQSLDLPSQGIELLSVKTVQVEEREKTIAVVYVPNEKVAVFIKRIEEYRDQETTGGKPKHASLVNGIENVRLVVVRSLWTDLDEAFPADTESIWWEIWLRATPDAIPRFNSFAQARDIRVSSRQLIFPDRHVILAYTTAQQLAASIDSLGFIAELRRAKETTADFLEMHNHEQRQWVDALRGLTDPPDPVMSPVVCILDTGVNSQHPLIDQFLPHAKLMTCDPTWNVNDHHGHGTEMAGLALYGDLNAALVSTERVQVPCGIESVKILPPVGANHPDLYGNITEEAVNRATISEPNRKRIICMAVASVDGRDRGQPSSWSAALDNICVGKSVEGKRHLFVVSAGNTELDSYIEYPNSNVTDQVHDPGQSWNALTVGAYTDKVDITETQFEGWTPLAQAGDIAPSSTTSVTWKSKWPIKPDIVFEGGNAALDQARVRVDHPDSLLLLTTDRATTGSMFTWTADTSASSAQAANMAAILSHEYPDFWPETVRALLVHSAEWTPRMRAAYPITNKGEREYLLRMCGYGVPDLKRARWSASNHLTLIVEDELKPFEGNEMKQLNIHNIPWPTEELRALGPTNVSMKVTLSYFIEPNPARRGWEHKFRYQSHGLRFDVRTPTETLEQFAVRLNRNRWDRALGRATVTTSGDSDEWFFGENIRSKGSIHCDIWQGSAARLAERGHIAVYPVVGWWREKHSEGHTLKRARYSLIVTIGTPATEVDIYTPIETQIVTEIETA